MSKRAGFTMSPVKTQLMTNTYEEDIELDRIKFKWTIQLYTVRKLGRLIKHNT